jgi:hypothetical protein
MARGTPITKLAFTRISTVYAARFLSALRLSRIGRCNAHGKIITFDLRRVEKAAT